MTAKEKEIKGFMEKYKISYEEAEEMWLFDNDKIEIEEINQMTEKAKKNFKNYTQGDKQRKKTTRERKVDNKKAYLLDLCEDGLDGFVKITGRKTETEIAFEYEGEKYTLKLTRHREKK